MEVLHSNGHFQKTLFFLIKCIFLSLFFLLYYFHYVHKGWALSMLCFLMFLCCCVNSRVWIIELNFFPFFLFFSSPFLTLIFCPPSTYFLWASCLVALPHCLIILPQHLVLLPCHLFVPCATSSYYLVPLSCCFNLLPRTTSLPRATSHCFATFLPCAPSLFNCHCTLSTSLPPHLLLLYLVALCWLVFPSSLLFCREELRAWRNKLSNNQKRLSFFFFLWFVFFCLFSFVK